MSDLRSRNFDHLVDMCTISKTVSQPATVLERASTLKERMAGRKTFYELYLPPPADSNNIAALEYHLTTRNFFAWMYDVPVVGRSLGTSLVAVLDRMNSYRPYYEQNRVDLMTFLESQGYYDFRMCPDHSLAALHLAETFEMPNVWRNAFVHCVGMYDMLHASTEYDNIGETTRASITRANVDMDTHLDRVVNSIGSFFEEFTSGSIMGLNTAAIAHLDRFRSFLITVHIERHGFWPPPGIPRQDTNFPREALMSLYLEFRCLYQFLVDPDSPGDALKVQRRLPGIDVEQMTRIFDQKHDFEPLPHCVPLVPQIASDLMDGDEEDGSVSALSMRRQSTPWRRTKADRIKARKALWKTLADATNYSPQTYATLIVRRYVEFEREILIEHEEEKVKLSLVDGRRVRWLLVYGILQVLISILKAPNDVSDMDGVEYPLCCRIPSKAPWEINNTESVSDADVRNVSFEGSSFTSGTSKSVKFESNTRPSAQSNHTVDSGVSVASSRPSKSDDTVSVIAARDGTASALQARAASYQETARVRNKASRPRSLLRFLGKKSTEPEFEHLSPDRGGSKNPAGHLDSMPTPTSGSTHLATSSGGTSLPGPENSGSVVGGMVADLNRTVATPSPLSSSSDNTPSTSTTPPSTLDEEIQKFPLTPDLKGKQKAGAVSGTAAPDEDVFIPSVREMAKALIRGTPIQMPSDMARSDSDRTIKPGIAQNEYRQGRPRGSSVRVSPSPSRIRAPSADYVARPSLLQVDSADYAKYQKFLEAPRRSHSQPPTPSPTNEAPVARLPQRLQVRRSTPQSPSSPSSHDTASASTIQFQNDIDKVVKRSRSTSRGRVQLVPANSYRSVTPTNPSLTARPGPSTSTSSNTHSINSPPISSRDAYTYTNSPNNKYSQSYAPHSPLRSPSPAANKSSGYFITHHGTSIRQSDHRLSPPLQHSTLRQNPSASSPRSFQTAKESISIQDLRRVSPPPPPSAAAAAAEDEEIRGRSRADKTNDHSRSYSSSTASEQPQYQRCPGQQRGNLRLVTNGVKV